MTIIMIKIMTIILIMTIIMMIDDNNNNNNNDHHDMTPHPRLALSKQVAAVPRPPAPPRPPSPVGQGEGRAMNPRITVNGGGDSGGRC